MRKVVDTNVFIHGKGSHPFTEAVMTQKVLDEIKSSSGKNVLNNVSYQVREPSEEALESVESKSSDINSPTSEEDEGLLSLAIDLGLPVLTDDKALQNLAMHLGADFEGFLDKPAEEMFVWEKVCGVCGSPVSADKCGLCGSNRISRKQVRCSSE